MAAHRQRAGITNPSCETPNPSQTIVFSRGKEPALSLDVVTFDLCDAVTHTIRRHEHEETARFRLDRPDEGIRVRGDPDRIAQILDNLLSNAQKYSPASAPIDVAVTTISGEAQVRVEDYGIGVAAEERDRMFAAYYRTSRTRAIQDWASAFTSAVGWRSNTVDGSGWTTARTQAAFSRWRCLSPTSAGPRRAQFSLESSTGTNR